MAAREHWKPIVRFESKYEVSDLGRIRNAETKYVLKPFFNNCGYLIAQVAINRTKHVATVSSLVAEAFLGPRPPGMQIEHLNQDKTDNRLVNLTYMTQSQNIKRSYANSDRPRRNGPRLSQQAHDLINQLWATGQYSQVQIAKLLDVSSASVNRIVRGLSKAAGTRDLAVRDVDVTVSRGCAHHIKIGGVIKPLKEWLRQYDLSQHAYSLRRRQGLTPAEAITLPKRVGVSVAKRVKRGDKE